MEYQDEKEILIELRDKIFKEKNSKKKLLYLDDYFSLISYLDKLNVIDLEKEIEYIGNNINYYLAALGKEKEKFCKKFLKNFTLIDNVVDNIMNIYNEYPIVNIEYQAESTINVTEGISLLYDFLVV